MTTRIPALLGILAVAVIALISVNASAGEVIELTNESVEAYEQPCYTKATTKTFDFDGITTWCDVDLSGEAQHVYCTSAAEPTYCGDSK